MKEALEKIMEELRNSGEDSNEEKQQPPSEQESSLAQKWEHYVETD